MALTEAPAKLLADLTDPSNDVHEEAATALAACGPEDKAAVPALVGGVTHTNPDVRFWAVVALGRIGPDASEGVSALVMRLGDPVIAIRQAAAKALPKIGSAAVAEGVPALLDLFRTDEKWSVRIDCSQALRDLGAQSSELVDALIDALADPDEFVRKEAVIGLEYQGQRAQRAIPLLERIANDETQGEGVRMQASKAANAIAGTTESKSGI